jgi:Mn-containing catalase
MFIHNKEPIVDVRVGTPDPIFAEKLLEQFGGATGELCAALQYFVQSFHTENAGIRDMLQSIATEELGHLEMVGMLVEQHTERASAAQRDTAYESTLFSIRGKGPHFLNAQGEAWTASYINEGGSTVRDLRANIAAEAGALETYECLLRLTEDEGSIKVLQHLATREVAHAKMFMLALQQIGKFEDALFGDLTPDETVNVYLNMSTGPGETRGPWNSEPNFRFVEHPAPHLSQQIGAGAAPMGVAHKNR